MYQESKDSWHYGSMYLSNGRFNPISTDNNLNSSCYYKPNPIPYIESVATYKDAEKFVPKQYNSYKDIYGGEIEYFPYRRTVIDNFQNPNFVNEAFIESKIYKDPMGAIKPEYIRTETKNTLKVDQLTWMQDSCEWREEIMAKQMRKDNQTRYDPRWNL